MCLLFYELHLFIHSFFQQLFLESLVTKTFICAREISVNKVYRKDPCSLETSNSIEITIFLCLCFDGSFPSIPVAQYKSGESYL